MKQSLIILLISIVTGCSTKLVGIDRYTLLDVKDIRTPNGAHYEFIISESQKPSDIGSRVLLCGIASNGELVTQLAKERTECLWDHMIDGDGDYPSGFLVNRTTLTPSSKWWRDNTMMTLQKVKKSLDPSSKYQDNDFKLAVLSFSRDQLYKDYQEFLDFRLEVK